jgi:hypothetical protein
MRRIDSLDRTRYVPIQRHINTVPIVRCNLPFRLRSASTWAGIGAGNGCRNIREHHTDVLANLTGNIEGSSVRNTGRARLGVRPRTSLTTGGLGAVDPLAANRTGRGALEPLLLRR